MILLKGLMRGVGEVMNNTHVFIIGSKGIPANYGVFESFVDRLTFHKSSDKLSYHVACVSDKKHKQNVVYNQSDCFFVYVPDIGAAKAVYYDLSALRKCIDYIQKNKIEHFVIYILACRIGPFIGYYAKRVRKLGGKLFINPDGHEWLRAKWNRLIKKYWKLSERGMVKHADLVICDSKNIESYIKKQYALFKPNTCYIAYGAETSASKLKNVSTELKKWYEKFKIRKGDYYLIVGRFGPENNYETIIREFMKNGTKKSLVIITNVEHNKFYQKLELETGFKKDKRIKFCGTVYCKELLQEIRENAFAYIHGHEVGGTNPSLLEALAATRLNLLLDIGFNREVAEGGALYWNKAEGSLSGLLTQAEGFSEERLENMGNRALKRIKENYEWSKIVRDYEEKFMQQ